MDDKASIDPEEAPPKNLVWYFDAQVFASYRSEPHKYVLTDDYFEGRLRITDAYYEELEAIGHRGGIDILFGYRTLQSGELAVAAWFPDLDKIPEEHKRRWDGFRLANPQWLDYQADNRFRMWMQRYMEGSWDVPMGVLSRLKSVVQLINGLTEEAVGIPLFKYNDATGLHFPAAENTHAYQDSHKDLYGYLIDGINKECITQIAARAGQPLNISSERTVTALKKVLPALATSPAFTAGFEKISVGRRGSSHGVNSARHFAAFEEFAKDLEQCVLALLKLQAELERVLGMNAEKATARRDGKRMLPKLDMSRPIHANYAIAQAPLMVGKTVKSVELGFRQSMEQVHESEALIIHFTDGSILGISTGSNVCNVCQDHEDAGLQPREFHVDLDLWWVPEA